MEKIEDTLKVREEIIAEAPTPEHLANLGRILLGLFRKRNTRNIRYLCSFGSYSVFGMNGISFRSFCSRQQNEQNGRNAA